MTTKQSPQILILGYIPNDATTYSWVTFLNELTAGLRARRSFAPPAKYFHSKLTQQSISANLYRSSDPSVRRNSTGLGCPNVPTPNRRYPNHCRFGPDTARDHQDPL